MKLLIYGAGVVGCTYGWQLSEAGHDVTVLVRKGKQQVVEQNGIRIQCDDFRGNEKKSVDIIFHPKAIEELSPENDYEYIIVPTNNLQLKDILPTLGESAGRAHIVFFQNIWDDFEAIANSLSPEQYFFGFPFMVGGGRDEQCIHSAISGMEYSHTPLGEVNGKITPRVEKLAKAFEEARLKPIISKQIITWLITHYAVAAGLSGGIIKAGRAIKFTNDLKNLREAILCIREGFEVCVKRGINPKAEKANRLYLLPLFISTRIAKKIYSNEVLRFMFDGHVNHSPEEIKKMLEDVIAYGEKFGIDTPHLKKMRI